MGGRGTFASGKSVGYTYKTVGKIAGVKVLQGLDGKHNLPEEAHSSEAYILTDKNGNFVRYRGFNSDHSSKFDIDYHPEKKISGHYNPIFHIHEYKNGVRSPLGRTLTKLEYKKYKKYFRGAIKLTGLSFNEFYDKLYYGADIEFTLNKWHYMIYCGWKEISEHIKIHSIEMVKSDQPFYEQVTTNIA